MQPSSGTRTEVRQCGMISPREPGEDESGSSYWKKDSESPGVVFFCFLKLCKKKKKSVKP